MNAQSLCAGVLAAALCSAAAAQRVPQATPDSVGLSPERLALIGPALEREIEAERMPGAVIAVARRGRLVYYEAFGWLDKAAGTPMPRDAIFSIWSMTKPIAAVAALQLFERGELMVNEPIAAYLPELADRRVAIGGDPDRTETALRQPTIRDLMRHTSGYNYGGGRTAVDALYPNISPLNGDITAEGVIEALRGVPLHHQPGTVWEYGLGLDLLGIVVERVSGRPFGEYLEEEIFAPLGMVDTGFDIPRGERSRQARVLPADPITGAAQVDTDHSVIQFECGGGCLASTALDYLSFAQMLLDGGTFAGQRILGSRTVRYMTADHTSAGVDESRMHSSDNTHDDGYGYGLGVAVRRGYGTGGTVGSPGEFHWFGAYGTAFWVDPVEELVIVFMAQTPGLIRRYNRQLVPALVYQAIVD